MIIEKLKTYIIAIGVFIAAVFTSLFVGEWKGIKKQKAVQESENSRAEVEQLQKAQQTFQEAKIAEHSIPSIVTPNVEKRDDLDTTH